MQIPIALREGSRICRCAMSYVLALAFVHAILTTGVAAAPPSQSDPTLAQWFEKLKQPGRDVPCCSVADCRITDSRPSPAGYDVLIEGRWYAVPPDRILQHVSNPTANAVVCYRWFHAGNGAVIRLNIFCFVRPPEA